MFVFFYFYFFMEWAAIVAAVPGIPWGTVNAEGLQGDSRALPVTSIIKDASETGFPMMA